MFDVNNFQWKINITKGFYLTSSILIIITRYIDIVSLFLDWFQFILLYASETIIRTWNNECVRRTIN